MGGFGDATPIGSSPVRTSRTCRAVGDFGPGFTR